MNEKTLDRSDSGISHEDRWRVVLVLIVSGAIWGFLALCGHRWLIYPDAMEYAQTARNLSEGRGRVTETIWTLRTAYPLKRPPADIRRPLLWPGILSLVFRAGGATDASATLATGLMGCLAAGLLYLLARRSLGPLESFIAAIVFSFQTQVILMNQSGLSEPLFTVILLLLCLTLVQAIQPWKYLVGGVLVGLSQWVRLNGFWLLVPLVAWLLWQREKGWRKRLALLAIGAAVLLLPLAIRNWRHIGTFSIVGLPGVSIVGEIPPFPDHGAERWLEPIPVFQVLTSDFGALFKKYILGLSKNLNALFGWCIHYCGAVPDPAFQEGG
jgi:4-amino-4-deoxy-L-arabinose transferase-like glycosyltransferase